MTLSGDNEALSLLVSFPSSVFIPAAHAFSHPAFTPRVIDVLRSLT